MEFKLTKEENNSVKKEILKIKEGLNKGSIGSTDLYVMRLKHN